MLQQRVRIASSQASYYDVATTAVPAVTYGCTGMMLRNAALARTHTAAASSSSSHASATTAALPLSVKFDILCRSYSNKCCSLLELPSIRRYGTHSTINSNSSLLPHQRYFSTGSQQPAPSQSTSPLPPPIPRATPLKLTLPPLQNRQPQSGAPTPPSPFGLPVSGSLSNPPSSSAVPPQLAGLPSFLSRAAPLPPISPQQPQQPMFARPTIPLPGTPLPRSQNGAAPALSGFRLPQPTQPLQQPTLAQATSAASPLPQSPPLPFPSSVPSSSPFSAIPGAQPRLVLPTLGSSPLPPPLSSLASQPRSILPPTTPLTPAAVPVNGAMPHPAGSFLFGARPAAAGGRMNLVLPPLSTPSSAPPPQNDTTASTDANAAVTPPAAASPFGGAAGGGGGSLFENLLKNRLRSTTPSLGGLSSLTPQTPLQAATNSFADSMLNKASPRDLNSFLAQTRTHVKEIEQKKQEDLEAAADRHTNRRYLGLQKTQAERQASKDGRILTAQQAFEARAKEKRDLRFAERMKEERARQVERVEREKLEAERKAAREAAEIERIANMSPAERAEHDRQIELQRKAEEREERRKRMAGYVRNNPDQVEVDQMAASEKTPEEQEAYLRRTVTDRMEQEDESEQTKFSKELEQLHGVPLHFQPLSTRLVELRDLHKTHDDLVLQLKETEKIFALRQAVQPVTVSEDDQANANYRRSKRREKDQEEQLRKLEQRIGEVLNQIQPLENSLQHTQEAFSEENAATSLLEREQATDDTDEITLPDGTGFDLTASPDSRSYFLHIENAARRAYSDMQEQYPGKTSDDWWTMMKEQLEQEYQMAQAKLSHRMERERLRMLADPDLTEAQRTALEPLKGELLASEIEQENALALRQQAEDEEYELQTGDDFALDRNVDEDDEFGMLGEDGEEDEDGMVGDEDDFEGEDDDDMRMQMEDDDGDGDDLFSQKDSVDEAAIAAKGFQATAAAQVAALKPSVAKHANEITVFHAQTLGALSHKLGKPIKELIWKLNKELDLNTTLTPQSLIREDVARLLIEEYKFIPVKGERVIQPQLLAQLRKKAMTPEEYLALPLRPPVITVMGHVDHGKTSLLDRLRRENRAAGEAGGITQAIGAFRVNLNEEKEAEEDAASPSSSSSSSKRKKQNALEVIQPTEDADGKPTYATFLDTPGHAAFKSMRARGCSSSCTDMVILVISAADGIQPQSLEVIQLARQNNVPLIIAINKIDVPGADPNAIIQQLQVHDVVVESVGGEILSCNISAKTGEGIAELKDCIRLQQEVLQLHADRSCPGEAYVIESRVNKKGGGCVANILVRNGSVKVGQHFVCGLQHGKIRSLIDENEKQVLTEVYPGQAVQLTGLKSLEDMTEDLYIVESEEQALRILADRQTLLDLDEDEVITAQQLQQQIDQKLQAYKIQVTRRKKRVAIRPLTEEEKVQQAMKDNSVPVLVKSDVSGSMDVLLDYFTKIPRDEVLVSIVKSSLGEITAADVEYASEIGGGATIFGFNVKPTSEALLLAKQKGIRLFHNPVIYSLWDDIRAVVSEKLPVELEEVQLGQAEVLQLFPMSAGGGKKKQKADAAAAAADGADDTAATASSVSEVAMVAGCRVRSGKIDAKMSFKIVREEETIFDGSCISLRVNRDIKPFVEKGAECGIRLSSGSDSLVAIGDLIECYTKQPKKKLLDDSAARGFAPGASNLYDNYEQ